ncbi:MAG: response regulator [Sulfurimonas sp.]|uniref:hybrid sensor histidine kinase/response regulator n=1 Tax=Sulfurimonas sp. TaxID=2022749 RepID=UPI002618A130|nr:response regulator [Sulfurimonas sp.]MDD2652969.1 response regulator [Sulfurimonas sp.]MDD3452415.1 response regulator [Sulfurimonas sp.]
MEKFDRLKSITVLYVEDSKFLAKNTVLSIESIFHKIYVAHDGAEALEIFAQHKDEIDIIITDLIMPILDGNQMIKEIRKNGCNIPVIVTTGFDDYLEREKIIELSIEAFLSKPINIYKLLKSVNNVVDALFIKRELEAKKAMIDNDIIYVETNIKGVITYVSKPFEYISGYTKAELIGKSHAILRSEETADLLYADMWNNLNRSVQWQGEITNKRKDGSFYTVQIVISPMYYRKKLIGYSATSIDVTELKAASSQLQLKSKQAAMGEMVAMIAHQWRQPITSIGMIANNLEFDLMMDELDNDTLSQSLKTIDTHVKYLSNTIDIFRNFLQVNKKKERVHLKNIIRELLMLTKDELREQKISMEVFNGCDNYPIATYSDELLQAMINIVSNAKEALVERNIQKAKIKIECMEQENTISIAISDNAGGIKEDIMSKIFTPYFSTKSQKNGTGLGLYMTRIIVEENLDAKLIVQNTQDGVMFTIVLPK